jgi:hypothetical protein
MVSRFFNAIGEVLAPTLRTPLEDFRLHWRAIKHFYIDDKGTRPHPRERPRPARLACATSVRALPCPWA